MRRFFAEMENRFDRQIILDGFSDGSIDILKNKQVAVIGAGAVAASALPLLASCGIGHLKICDGDNVSLSNLHRQTLFEESDIGKNKARLVATRLSKINQSAQIEIVEKKLESVDEVRSFINGVDLCLDATDSFASRTMISNACAMENIREIACTATEYLSQMFFFDKSFKFSDIVANGDNEETEPFAIFPASSHLSGIWGAGATIKILLQIEEFKAGYMQQFDFRNNNFFKCNLK